MGQRDKEDSSPPKRSGGHGRQWRAWPTGLNGAFTVGLAKRTWWTDSEEAIGDFQKSRVTGGHVVLSGDWKPGAGTRLVFSFWNVTL